MSVVGAAALKLLSDNKSGILRGIKNFLGTSFNRFKQGGWSCLGRQAFHEGDLENFYNDLQNRLNAVTDNPQSMADFMNHCSRSIVESDLEIGRYRSKCSKQNREAYKKTLQNMLNSYPKEGFKTETRSATDWKGTGYNYTHYIPVDEYFNPPKMEMPALENPIEDKKNSEDNFGSGLVNNLLEGNLVEIDPALYTPGLLPGGVIEELELVGNSKNGGGSWGIGAGGRTSDGTDWNVNVGKSQEDMTMKYILLGVLGLVAYKVLFDKK